MNPDDIGSLIAAIGALGTASFALVDATKISGNFGVSNSGFGFIDAAVRTFLTEARRKEKNADAMNVLDTLHGNWINGVALADQKAIAKSLIKLRLSEDTAAAFAKAADVDEKVLKSVAEAMRAGTEIKDQAQINALGRFDLALTAILDDGYQHADQKYRNTAKVLASAVAIVLAVVGGWAVVGGTASDYFGSAMVWQAALCGLVAVPLAPITKDVASALQAGVKVAQAIRK
jgi:hypothetical protein